MNGAEIIIIAVVIAVIFLGVKKIPELTRSFGKASIEYEKAKIEAKREMQQIVLTLKSNDHIQSNPFLESLIGHWFLSWLYS